MKKSLGAKTLLYPTPVVVVGTYDANGKPNVATAAWVGICCSRPPCVAVSFRAATYTHGNILARKAFTVCVPSETHIRETDFFGIASGRDTDKFAVTRLTPVKSEVVDAPYVEEFPLVLECKLARAIELGLHTQFVGEIVDVKADEEVLGPGNSVDLLKLRPILFTPEPYRYYGVGAFLGNAFSVGAKYNA
ncbi:MAG: flavin reductase family protein [Verrucomicrobiae bacterium]|nr:flavin reductase family protein [Verrucomicrobiae bacterium]